MKDTAFDVSLSVGNSWDLHLKLGFKLSEIALLGICI